MPHPTRTCARTQTQWTHARTRAGTERTQRTSGGATHKAGFKLDVAGACIRVALLVGGGPHGKVADALALVVLEGEAGAADVGVVTPDDVTARYVPQRGVDAAPECSAPVRQRRLVQDTETLTSQQ